jgi:hypothetical protein
MSSRLGVALLNSGAAVFALGLTTGGFLMWGLLVVSPAGVCTAASETTSAAQVWPWALSLLVVETLSFCAAAIGIGLIVHARHGTVQAQGDMP